VGLLAGLAASPRVSADNLLANPGFETGNFTGWSTTGPFMQVQGGGRTDNFRVYCGSGMNDNGTVGDLFSQSVITTPGMSYDISIWVDGMAGGPTEAYIEWDSVKVLDLSSTDFAGWTQLQVTVTASSGSSTVGFGSRHDPGAYRFDDASVTLSVVPEPSTFALGALGLAGLWILRRKR
jgi:hypothetical protein